MPKLPPRQPLTRVPARLPQPPAPTRPKPGAITPLPDRTHEIIVRAPQPVGDPDALAADQRFAKLTAPHKYVMNRMTALKYIAVVTIFEEKLATELGIEKSYALFKYASIKSKPEDAPQLVAENPEVGNEGEHLLDLSARDILRAAQDLKAAKPAQAPSDLEHAARRAARLVQAWIRKAGAREAVARARRHEGEWGVNVRLSTAEAEACTVLKK